MSIVRIGLGETKNFAEGYEAIFGKKKDEGGEGKSEKASKKDDRKSAKKKPGKKK